MSMVSTGSKTGIPGHINSLGHEPNQYTMFYVEVADIHGALGRAEELGGTTMVPSTEVPGMGHFAWFTDPEGNTIGLWQSM